MTNNQQQVATRDSPVNAITALRVDLEKMAPQFRYALPAHIPVERFMRVVMTAVQNNPRLLRCTRQSFFNACMRCAQDGLLPDGRDAAIVPFNDEDGGVKSDQAQYLPMIAGIRKKVRNSGLLRDWSVQVVQEGDQFEYELGDRPFIRHKPAPAGGRTRPVLFAYSIATYPDGTLSREVMNIDQIKDIQKLSKAKKGPWSNPVFFPEMCRKTVAKLHSKQLPMSTDLDTLLRRDDELYDFPAARERGRIDQTTKPPPSVGAALDQFAGGFPDEPGIETGETPAAMGGTGGGSTDPSGGVGGSKDRPEDRTEPAAAEAQSAASSTTKLDPLAVAHQRGIEAKRAGHARRAMPGEYRAKERTEEAGAWQRGWDEAEAAKPAAGATGASGPLIAIAAFALLCLTVTPGLAAHRHPHPGPAAYDAPPVAAGIAPDPATRDALWATVGGVLSRLGLEIAAPEAAPTAAPLRRRLGGGVRHRHRLHVVKGAGALASAKLPKLPAPAAPPPPPPPAPVRASAPIAADPPEEGAQIAAALAQLDVAPTPAARPQPLAVEAAAVPILALGPADLVGAIIGGALAAFGLGLQRWRARRDAAWRMPPIVDLNAGGSRS